MKETRSRLAAIYSNLVSGTALDRSRTHEHAGPPHPGYDLQPGLMRTLVLTFSTGFGTGLSPVASGTTGTIPGILLFWFMAPPHGTWTAYILASVVFIMLAILTANAAEGIYGQKDDGRIVIDEVVGYLATMLWAPHTWQAAALGFVLFRFFDVVKLPPAFKLQNLRGGWGVVLDDVVSGLYACAALHVLFWLWRVVA